MTNCNKITFRRLEKCEVPAALELAWQVFEAYESPDYSAEGTEEFRKCLHDDKYLAGIEYYGALNGDAPIAMAGIRKEQGHICFFFVDGRFHRRGIGTRLFETVKAAYAGKMITLNASPYGLPFYRKLGFVPTDAEQTVNGIRFTPMILRTNTPGRMIVKLSERRDYANKAAAWFSEKWGVPKELYQESIEASFASAVPSWYVYLEDGKIIGGMGVIENDFHDRKDLAPNVCAVFTEPEYRGLGICGALLDFVCADMKQNGINTLYLLTDHTEFYERYGWQFLCTAQGDGEERLSRMYVKTTSNP